MCPKNITNASGPSFLRMYYRGHARSINFETCSFDMFQLRGGIQGTPRLVVVILL